jgi:hypothetical protein
LAEAVNISVASGNDVRISNLVYNISSTNTGATTS